MEDMQDATYGAASVWLTRIGFVVRAIVCRDGDAEEHYIPAVTMNAGQREISRRMHTLGYQPTGPWRPRTGIAGLTMESSRTFHPTDTRPP